MAITKPRPFTGQMPDAGDPASFDVRMTALMTWFVSQFSPDVVAAADDMDAALDGDESTLEALQTLQVAFDGLGTAAGENVTDNDDLSVSGGNIPTRGNVKAFVEALVSDQAQAGFAAEVPTTSGTGASVSGIPAGVTEINIFFNGVAFSGNADRRLIRIGNGSVETTGYVSQSSRQPTSGNQSTATDGFIFHPYVKDPHWGIVTLKKGPGHKWFITSSLKAHDNILLMSGYIELAAAPDRIRLQLDGGSNTLDGGSISVSWRY